MNQITPFIEWGKMNGGDVSVMWDNLIISVNWFYFIPILSTLSDNEDERSNPPESQGTNLFVESVLQTWLNSLETEWGW